MIAIIVLTALFFYPLVFQGKVFSSPDAQAPQGFAVYAERERAQTGEYPLWNPFIFCGLPSYSALAYNPDVYFPDWILKPLALDHTAHAVAHRLLHGGCDRPL